MKTQYTTKILLAMLCKCFIIPTDNKSGSLLLRNKCTNQPRNIVEMLFLFPQ